MKANEEWNSNMIFICQ